MQYIFLKVLSMGADACWIILAVIFLRVVFYRAPKWIVCFLWILAGLRLICPLNIESSICLIPRQIEFFYSNINNAVVNNNENHVHTSNIQPSKDNNITANSDNKQSNGIYNSKNSNIGTKNNYKTSIAGKMVLQEKGVIHILTIIWIVGMTIMFLYLSGSYFYMRKRLLFATHLYGNIWESERVSLPFIFGLVRPRIYIPYHMNQKQLSCILTHEYAHLRRKDHILKASAFIILSIYWFHPLVWAAYTLLCRDIEFACDEMAVLSMNTQERKDYLSALLYSRPPEFTNLLRAKI